MFALGDAVALFGACMVLFGIIWRTKSSYECKGITPEDIPKLCPEHSKMEEIAKNHHDNIISLFDITSETKAIVVRIETILTGEVKDGKRKQH